MVFGVDVPFYDPGTYWLTRFVLQRGLAAIYLVAFVVALRQFHPLCGEDGLLPIADYVDRFSFRERPSLLYLSPTDRTAAWLARAGIALSALALLGVPSMLGTPVAVAVWLALWGLYHRYATPAERRETGDWWRRERVGTYARPIARDSTHLELALRRRGWD